jgi:hypothetical protein
MPIDLQKELPRLLPGAVAWALAQSNAARVFGVALTDEQQALARRVGVQQPRSIRLAHVDELPMPEDAELAAAGLQAGFFGPDMVGLTLGYSIFVRRGHASRRVLAHEFRHVHQFERHRSLAEFIREYLGQIVVFGYDEAPYEQDARAHEEP